MDVVNVTHPSPAPAPCQMRQDVTNQFGDPLPRGQSIYSLFSPQLMIFWAAIARLYSHVHTLGFKPSRERPSYPRLAVADSGPTASDFEGQ